MTWASGSDDVRLLVPTLLALFVAMLAGCSQSYEPPQLLPAESEHPLRNSSFSWAPAFPDVGEEVQFQPKVRSSAPGDSLEGFLWRIDGREYNDNQPSHVFATAGVHRVSMTVVTAEAGQFTVDRDIDVIAADGRPAPVATDEGSSTPPEDVPPPDILTVQDGAEVAFAFSWNLTADQLRWDFGDGATSDEERPVHAYRSKGDFDVTLRVASGGVIEQAQTQIQITEIPFKPHVIVGIPDTGINPYHEMFHRPELTGHPCTYIEDFPCDIPALELSVGSGHGSWNDRFQADQEIWNSIKKDTWYWIPQTVFVGVYCDSSETREQYRGDYCILDDAHMHGTGTVSSALMENPDALFAFKDGGSSVAPILSSEIPVDVLSVSWGSIIPIPVLGYAGDAAVLRRLRGQRSALHIDRQQG